MKKLELLSPAGSLDILKAVIQAGADAVYLGGSRFGARAYAKNFTEEQVLEGLDYAHMFGSKIFLTVNTLLKNKELNRELYDYIEPFYQRGLDAVIVQDYGVLSFLHREFPDLPLHASTQMSVTNGCGAEFLKENGVKRIVTAREISLEEIRDLYESTGMEIESFIHGALCYCYSGQCLFSSMLGGRSGNRGRCAQPCRLNYQVIDKKNRIYNPKELYPVSPKDLCTIKLLPAMAEAGVYSLKIEGRMKQAEYAAGVTSVYRKYLDLYENDPGNYAVSEEDWQYLLDLGNRGGFTEGYYEKRNDRFVMSFVSSAYKSNMDKKTREIPARNIALSARAECFTGSAFRLHLSDGRHTLTVAGAEVLKAQKQPLKPEELEKRLKKTGDTVFQITNLSIQCDPDAFLPVKQINELRREALDQFGKLLAAPYHRTLPEKNNISPVLRKAQNASEKLSVLIRQKNQLNAVLEASFVNTVLIETDCFHTQQELSDAVLKIQNTGKEAFFCLPPTVRKQTVSRYLDWEQKFWEQFDGVLARSYDGLGFALHALPRSVTIHTDYGLYAMSDTAGTAFLESGAANITAPLELNEKELRDWDNRRAELVIYGWIPLMVTAQCLYKNFDRCYKNKPAADRELYLKDRYLKKFLITRNCKDCYNVIYNSQPLYLMHHSAKISDMKFQSLRIEFLSESEQEIKRIFMDYQQAFMEKKKIDMSAWENRFTNGHFRRGIE
ncbi:Uncharacterized protease yhbU precursor [uncultured Roseburia sp.]|uniref:U32 family peptidase n=1 Tax=Brotonthovivens ammoniilytica TaxID=2981725 RepID=A0ABT2TGI0_9FIRM|nr:U32 family peptidase [Brotonthovivens ammoniilytica]MCU6761299.1 U32 family peptidase [Brotonthovivens ammoniilytica]SCI24627.1 Uncharacterized protease yhbU precursor [uncultured Roseburia sp.]